MNERGPQGFDAAAMKHLLAAPWRLAFGRDGTEDFGRIVDAEGDEIVSSQHSRTCWLPEEDGDEVPVLVHQMRVMAAAPGLLAACKLALSSIEADLEANDPQARTQTGWEAEPMRTLRAAIAEAGSGQAES